MAVLTGYSKGCRCLRCANGKCDYESERLKKSTSPESRARTNKRARDSGKKIKETETSVDACLFPQRKPTSSYAHGCRCARCKTGQKEYYLVNKEHELIRIKEWRKALIASADFSVVGCVFPRYGAGTSYGLGCRCERCLSGAREKRAKNKRNYPESDEIRQRRLDRQREYHIIRYQDPVFREKSKKARKDRREKYSDIENAKNAHRDREKSLLTSPVVTGIWSKAEIDLMIAWEGTLLELAFATGRGYRSVKTRHRIVRKLLEQGCSPYPFVATPKPPPPPKEPLRPPKPGERRSGECIYPQWKPSTGYVRGCRCLRCGGWRDEYFDRYRSKKEAESQDPR